MSSNADNITNARPYSVAGAAFSCAAEGATIPTTAAAELDEGFVSLGYLSEDGIKLKIDETEQTVTAFGGDEVVSWTSEHKVEITITPLELINAQVLKEMFGSSNVSSDGKTISIKSTDKEERAFVFEMALRDGSKCRIVAARCEVVSVGEIAFTTKDVAAGELTIRCLPDSSDVKTKILFATAA